MLPLILHNVRIIISVIRSLVGCRSRVDFDAIFEILFVLDRRRDGMGILLRVLVSIPTTAVGSRSVNISRETFVAAESIEKFTRMMRTNHHHD